MFGQFKTNEKSTLLIFNDLTRRETYLLLPLVFFTLLFGIYPNLIFSSLHMSVNNYITLI